MTVTAASIAATKQIAAALFASHGWTAGYSGAAAERRIADGVVSLGHDGSVVLFDRRHPSGYPLAPLALGSADLAAPHDVAAAHVATLASA